MEIIHSGYFEVIFKQLMICTGLNITGNEASSFQTIIDITGGRGAIDGFTSNSKAVPLYCNFNHNHNKYTEILNYSRDHSRSKKVLE